MYFSNSQASRDLPIPATPTTESRCARRSSARGVEEVLDDAQLAVAADERRLEAGDPALAAPRRDDPQRTPELHGLGLALELVLAGVLVRRSPPRLARRVASPTSTVPGSAARLDARGGVDEVTGDHALTLGAERDGRLAGEHPGASAQARAPISAPSAATASTRSSAARTARSASSSFATGAPQTAITASPMNFSTVPP